MRKSKMILLALALPALVLLSSFGGGRSLYGGSYSKPEGWDLEDLILSDGTYQGESTGFREGLTVDVTVEKGEITLIEIVDHREIGPQFYKRPMDLIPDSIVNEQKTKVDSVSGATATSMGIMAAVEDALKQARKD